MLRLHTPLLKKVERIGNPLYSLLARIAGVQPDLSDFSRSVYPARAPSGKSPSSNQTFVKTWKVFAREQEALLYAGKPPLSPFR